MAKAEKKGTFFGGVAILTLGVVLVKIIGAIYKIPLGRLLTDEAYTDFDTAYSIYNLFLTISTAGLPVALSKTISEANALGRENQVRRTFAVALQTFLLMGAVSFVAMFFFSQPLAAFMETSSAAACIKALSPSVLCVCAMSAFRGYYQGHSNMVPTAVSQVIESGSKLVFGLALAYAALVLLPGSEVYKQRMTAVGAILGVSIGSVIALAFLLGYFLLDRKKGRDAVHADHPDPTGAILSRLLRLAIPITLGSAALSIVTIIDGKVVMALLKQMYTDLPELITPEAVAQQFDPKGGVTPELFMAQGLRGVYNKCMTIFNLPAQLMIPITASVIPAVSACLARRDGPGASRTSESALRIGAMLCLPMGFGLCALGGPIVQLLFKLDQAAAGPIMSVLGLASIFVCLMYLCNSILQAHGLVYLPIVAVVVGGVVKVAVNYVLVGNYAININGAPVGTLCCFAVTSLLELFFIRRSVKSPPKYLRAFLKPLAASVLMGAAAWACYGLIAPALGNSLSTLIAICVGVVVYAVLILALRAISPDDLALMPKGDKIAKILKIQ